MAVFVLLGSGIRFLRLFTPGISLNGCGSIFNDTVLKYLMVPSVPGELLYRPWTIITYMFTHFNFLHILFNMLMLYLVWQDLHAIPHSQAIAEHLYSRRTGRCNLLYIVFINGFPGLREYLGSSMLGASASIMAIVIAISFYVPDYTLYLFFIGPVRLKYIAHCLCHHRCTDDRLR